MLVFYLVVTVGSKVFAVPVVAFEVAAEVETDIGDVSEVTLVVVVREELVDVLTY